MSDDRPKASQECKVFIGGLHLSTTRESLEDYFGTWGTVVDAVVMTDPHTKRSRGFGFVTYDESSSVDECLKAKTHVLDGREVEAKRAVPREESNPAPSHGKIKKVFLGGLHVDTKDEDIRTVLEEFGELEEVSVITEKETDKPRGFGFATFAKPEAVDRLCRKKYVKIMERDVEVKRAVSREDMRKVDSPRGHSGGSQGGNYGGGRDPYAGGRADSYYPGYGRGGGGMNYGAAMGGYYSRYPGGGGTEYARPEAYTYPYAGYTDRTGAAAAAAYAAYSSAYPDGRGYDLQAAYGMYGAGGMGGGAYAQTTSTYGPSRTNYGGRSADYGKDRGTGGYHPYRRAQ